MPALNKNRIIDELKKACADAEKQSAPSQLPEDDLLWIKSIKSSQNLRKTLEEQDYFKKNKSIRMYIGFGWVSFEPERCANLLLFNSMKYGIERSYKSLEKVIQNRKSTIIFIHSIRGFSIKSKIKINDDFSIIPIHDIPNSDHKNKINRNDYSFSIYNNNSKSPYRLGFDPHNNDMCAIIGKMGSFPILQTEKNFQKEKNINHNELISRAKNYILLLTASAPCCAIADTYWFQHEDEDIEIYTESSKSLGNTIEEIAPLRIPVFTKRVDSEILDTFLKYDEITDKKFKKQILISLERLRNSLLKSKSGDKSLELCIALECLCGQGFELRYRVSTRVARMCSNNTQERILISNIIRKLYDFRSAYVHSGKDPSGRIQIENNKYIETSEIISRSTDITINFIRKIIQLGKIDWDEFDLTSELMLR